MSLSILLPELIDDILLRLPQKPLARFKCVSKHYNSLISDPEFTKLHLQRLPKISHTLISLEEANTWVITPHSVHHLLEHPSSITEEEEDASLRFNMNENDCFTIGSANGLVSLISVKSQKGGIKEICTQFWNPTLRLRSEDSPNLTPPTSNDNMLSRVHFGFGYDDLSDTYKVVAVFWNCIAQKMEAKVHCMGDSSWRNTLACHDFPILLQRTIVGPFVNGSVNWLTYHNLNCHLYERENVTINQLLIFSLDLEKETCKYILLPDSTTVVSQDLLKLAVLRGCLCFYYNHMRTHFVLWEMKEFGVQESWTQLVNVSYVNLQIGEFLNWLLLPVCLSEDGDVVMLVCEEEDEAIMYNQKDGIVEPVELSNYQIRYADEHMQSLVLPCPHPH